MGIPSAGARPGTPRPVRPSISLRPTAMSPFTAPAPRSRTARRVLAAGIAAWAALVAGACVLKLRTFLYTDFDLAIFAQAVSGVLHGRWTSSVRGMAWLGDHSSLILVPLAPLGALVRPPVLLPALQSAALALAAWPLFLHARRRLGDEPAAALLAFAWLAHPALAHLALFEFHPETLATPLLLATAVALAANRGGPALGFGALAALAKEDVALPLATLGALARLRGPSRRAGLGLLAVAAGSLALSFGVLKPRFAHGEADYGAMYAAWGHTPREMLGALARRPLAALAAFVTTPGDPEDARAKLVFWAAFLGPFLALPLASPLSLLPAAPVLAEHFLSSRLEQHTILYQYTALTLPFAGFALVEGVARFARRRPRRLAGAVLAASLAGQLLAGPWSPGLAESPDAPAEAAWPTPHDLAMARWREAFQRALPAYGTIVADFPSLAPLSARDSLHSLHHVAAGHFTYSPRPYPAPAHVDGMLMDAGALVAKGELTAADLARIRAFVATRGLHVADAAGDLVRLQPGGRDTLAWLAAAPATSAAPLAHWPGAFALLSASLPAPVVAPGGRLPIVARWRRDGPLPGVPLVQWTVTGPREQALDAPPVPLGFGLADPAAWPAGSAWDVRTSWVAPAGLAAGEHTLWATLWWWRDGDTVPATPTGPARDAGDGMVLVGRFRVSR